jgi:hypothetical protein
LEETARAVPVVVFAIDAPALIRSRCKAVASVRVYVGFFEDVRAFAVFTVPGLHGFSFQEGLFERSMHSKRKEATALPSSVSGGINFPG